MGLLEMLLGPRLPQITADDLLGRLASAQPPVLLDVRTTVEFSSGHIAGAVNIPHEQLPARVPELDAHRERDIVIYCRSGVRAVHGIPHALVDDGQFRLHDRQVPVPQRRGLAEHGVASTAYGLDEIGAENGAAVGDGGGVDGRLDRGNGNRPLAN